MAIAKRRNIPVRTLDDGYLAHCLLTELWQDDAPGPFVLRGAGRSIDVWGYSRKSSADLIGHAQSFGDPSILDAIDGIDTISSRVMPSFPSGRRVGFLARVCPVVRLSKDIDGHRSGAELDVFLSHCLRAGREVSLSREAIYRRWVEERFGDGSATGATVDIVRMAGFVRTRLVRRTHGPVRTGRTIERPDVRLEGELTIRDGDLFLQFLAHGIGRHRAFGFGALLVVPPGSSYPRR